MNEGGKIQIIFFSKKECEEDIKKEGKEKSVMGWPKKNLLIQWNLKNILLIRVSEVKAWNNILVRQTALETKQKQSFKLTSELRA